MLTIHLRINDSATGKPTPVRLRITGPDGNTYPPFGRYAEFPSGRNEDVGGHLMLGRERWYYVDGSCEIKLPSGLPIRVQASKGPEYTPLDETVTLGSGQMSLRFTIARWISHHELGWYSGDSRCHCLSPHAALLEAAADDLDVVNLLACHQLIPSQDGMTYPTVSNLTAFSGQSPSLEADGRVVVVNTLNEHPVLGTVALLNSHRPVFPLMFGGDELDDWSLCDWCDQCHRKGGLTVWVDAFRNRTGPPGGEALIAAILGKIDAIEIDAQPRQQPLLPWVYHLWNAGFAIPLVGGSGKDSNRTALGEMRTYVSLRDKQSFGYKQWLEAVREGRSIVTNGPLISLDVRRNDPTRGEEMGLIAIGSVRGATPVDHLEIIGSEGVVQSVPDKAEGRQAALMNNQSCWVAARFRSVDGIAFAHTSPVVVGVGQQPLPRSPESIGALSRAIEATREWIESVGRFSNPKAKQHLLDLCADAHRRLCVQQ